MVDNKATIGTRLLGTIFEQGACTGSQHAPSSTWTKTKLAQNLFKTGFLPRLFFSQYFYLISSSSVEPLVPPRVGTLITCTFVIFVFIFALDS